MAWNWSRRVYRVEKILDARRAANAGALSRARLANADVKRVGEREAAEATRARRSATFSRRWTKRSVRRRRSSSATP